MKGFFKKAAALLMAGLMAGSMAAVPAFAEEAEDAAPEKVELNVAYMPNYASLWSVLTGMDKGYFEEEGIEIKLWEFADDALLRSQQWRAEALTLLTSDMALISFASRDRLRSLHQALYTAQTV